MSLEMVTRRVNPSYRASVKLDDNVDLSNPIVIQNELHRLKRKRRYHAKDHSQFKYFTEEIRKLTEKLSAFETPDFKYRTGESSGLGIIHKSGRSKAGRPNVGRPKGTTKTPLEKTITKTAHYATCLVNLLNGLVESPGLFDQLSLDWNEKNHLLSLLEKLPHYLQISQANCSLKAAG